MRNSLLGIALAFGVFFFAGGLGWWSSRPIPKISRETWDRIEIGMTFDEVEQIIGAPPSKDGGGFWLEDHMRALPDNCRLVYWNRAGDSIFVELDAKDRVRNSYLASDPQPGLSWWERLLAKLGIR